MATDRNGNYLPPNAPRFSATAVLVTIVALVFLAVAAIIGLSIVGDPTNSNTPLIVTILGFIGTTITSLLAFLRTDQTRRELHNGLIPAKVTEAVNEGVKRGTLQVKVDRAGMRTRSTDSDKEGSTDG